MATHSAAGEPGIAAGGAGTGSATGAEGARRVLAILLAFSPQCHTLTARDMAESTGIPLPSMYRYIALLRDMELLVGDERGSYHLSTKVIAFARAAEAAEPAAEAAEPAGEAAEPAGEAAEPSEPAAEPDDPAPEPPPS